MKHYDPMDPRDRLKAEIETLAVMLSRLINANGPVSDQISLAAQLEQREAELRAYEDEKE